MVGTNFARSFTALRMTETYEVLAEGYSKRSREQLCGRTEQNKTIGINYYIISFLLVRLKMRQYGLQSRAVWTENPLGPNIADK